MVKMCINNDNPKINDYIYSVIIHLYKKKNFREQFSLFKQPHNIRRSKQRIKFK